MQNMNFAVAIKVFRALASRLWATRSTPDVTAARREHRLLKKNSRGSANRTSRCFLAESVASTERRRGLVQIGSGKFFDDRWSTTPTGVGVSRSAIRDAWVRGGRGTADRSAGTRRTKDEKSSQGDRAAHTVAGRHPHRSANKRRERGPRAQLAIIVSDSSDFSTSVNERAIRSEWALFQWPQRWTHGLGDVPVKVFCRSQYNIWGTTFFEAIFYS